ncbi:YcgL domain-containing protein [Aidingimonas lacisalsi]|uniref:YcgL domain-containing protein n=1 Tax=Aidingimonas lacisalsi TaxID=2604086 RepID=UPI0011D1BE17|nr:YcgL domain-containing protein [Aidingimonas lacisalsi]
MTTDRLICEIFKSPRKEAMYLFVDKREGLERVPGALLERFGSPVAVTTLLLTPDKRLARVDASEVMEAVEEQGFYLQMPPDTEAVRLDPYRVPSGGQD